jgi:uncharacterized protein (TIGR02453 family)
MTTARKQKPSIPQVVPSTAAFSGFPAAGFELLAQLKKHNDRDWFLQHKSEYQQHVQQPMEALVAAVAAEFARRDLPLYAKERNPVMRVYRDIRFSPDKTPYKTHVAAELRRSFTNSRVMLYLHLSPEESLVAAGIWQPERPLLQLWRNAIVSDGKHFEKMIDQLRKGGLELSPGHSLASMPRGFQNYAEESFASSLKLTSFVVHRPLSAEECTVPDLVQSAVRFAVAAKPLLQFGWDIEDR